MVWQELPTHVNKHEAEVALKLDYFVKELEEYNWLQFIIPPKFSCHIIEVLHVSPKLKDTGLIQIRL